MNQTQLQQYNDANLQPTGIQALDDALNGGIPLGSSVLLAGTPGTGKTLLSMQWLFEGYCQFKEPGLYVSLTEPVTKVLSCIQKMSFFKKELLNPTQVFFTDLRNIIRGLDIIQRELGEEEIKKIVESLRHFVEQMGAKRVVIDSITAMCYRIKDLDLIRLFLFELATSLAQIQATVILISEVTDHHYSVFGIEDFLADGIMLMTLDTKRRLDPIRRLQIIKMRATNYDQSPIAFRITENGHCFFPRLHRKINHPIESMRVSTGITELDTISDGGFFKGSSILISGASGTGKTLMVLQCMHAALKRGEKVIFISFEESRNQLIRNAKCFNWDLECFENENKLILISITPDEKYLEEHVHNKYKLVLEFKPDLFILDSLSGLKSSYSDDYLHDNITRLVTNVKAEGVTVLITNCTANLLGSNTISEDQLSTYVDGVVMLRYIEVRSELRHGVFLLKLRGTHHNKSVHEIEITKTHGLVIKQAFTEFEGIMSGEARGLDKLTVQELADVTATLNNSSLVAMTDIEGTINYVNDKFIELSKYSEEELIGQNHRILKSGFHTPEFYEDLWRTISSGKIWQGELRNRAKDGSIYWVRSTIMPSLNKEKKITGYVAVRTPITDAMHFYEEAIRKIERGESVDDETSEIIDELRSGRYDIQKWRYSWMSEKKGES